MQLLLQLDQLIIAQLVTLAARALVLFWVTITHHFVATDVKELVGDGEESQ